MAANLRILRLVTGEEVLGEVSAETETTVTLKNPVRVLVMPSKTDPQNPSVAFAPFMQWSDDKELTLNWVHVITTASPIAEFVNQYNGMFGGIQIPNSKILVP